MSERRIVLSKDKIEFLETWKEEKHDHWQEIIQHVVAENKLQNHTHSIGAPTHDRFFTGRNEPVAEGKDFQWRK